MEYMKHCTYSKDTPSVISTDAQRLLHCSWQYVLKAYVPIQYMYCTYMYCIVQSQLKRF